jgi:hypothetical protein
LSLTHENQLPAEKPPAAPPAGLPAGAPSVASVGMPAVRWPSALQLGLSLFAILLLFGGAFIIAVAALVGGFMQDAGADVLTGLLTAASLVGIGILLIPSVYYSLFRLLGKPAVDIRPFLKRLRPGTWLLLFPLVVLLGLAVSQVDALAWLLLPGLHLLAIGVPVAWLVYLAVRDLPLGSSQRMWGVFNTGLALAPVLISLLELLAIGGLVLVAIVYIAGQPEIVADLMQFAEEAQNGLLTQQEMLDRLGPYLLRPGVILGVLAAGALIVPLIEEALKPLGVWLLAGRPLSARAGFAAGALSGAGFALTESLMMSSGGAEWAPLVVVRMGTGVIHILTAALTGWALALAWKQRRYGLLLGTYLTTVLIHGLWNGLSILTVFSELARMQNRPDALPVISRLAVGAPLALLLLTAGALLLLVFFNRRLVARVSSRPDLPAPAG